MKTDAISFIEDGLATLHRSIEDHGDVRNIQLATIAPAGDPDLRTVVLRAFERTPDPCAELHSDARAAKVGDIAHADRVALLAWSPPERLQIRLRGSARLHRADHVARARWETLSANARKPYGMRTPPGAPKAEPDDQSHLPPDEAFRQFVVIRVALLDIDILKLGPHGDQRRARGLFTSSGVTAHWVGA